MMKQTQRHIDGAVARKMEHFEIIEDLFAMAVDKLELQKVLAFNIPKHLSKSRRAANGSASLCVASSSNACIALATTRTPLPREPLRTHCTAMDAGLD